MIIITLSLRLSRQWTPSFHVSLNIRILLSHGHILSGDATNASSSSNETPLACSFEWSDGCGPVFVHTTIVFLTIRQGKYPLLARRRATLKGRFHFYLNDVFRKFLFIVEIAITSSRSHEKVWHEKDVHMTSGRRVTSGSPSYRIIIISYKQLLAYLLIMYVLY